METVQETKRQQRFQLLRYFTTASLIMFCLVAVLLGMFYGRVARTNLITLGEKNNVALTQAFANSIWAQFAPFLTSASGLGVEQLQVHPQTAGLRRAILALMEGLLVVKVKIYDIDGQTVFSTQANQIGQDKSSNAGFRSARAGQVASELTHRDTFSAFEQTIEDRDVLSSYLPIQRGGPTSPIEGVFEIYTDVTPLLENIQQMQRRLMLGVTLALAFLYVILFGIVRRADRIIRRQHTDLQAALGAAEQASRAKSAFLATMSHELRTPLNSIIGFSNQVLKNKHQTLHPQEQTYLKRVRDNGLHLLQLINDILDLSKVEAGHMELEPSLVAIETLVLETLEQFETQMRERNVQLQVELPPDMASLETDAGKLKQILLNLIGNAAKFTEQGSVTVRVKIEPDTCRPTRIEVIDTGIGIPSERLETIFERFQQGDNSMARKYGGSGLGLAISRALCEIMGYRLEVSSEVGKGSTFSLHFTAATAATTREGGSSAIS